MNMELRRCTLLVYEGIFESTSPQPVCSAMGPRTQRVDSRRSFNNGCSPRPPGGSKAYKVPLVVQGPKLGDLLSRSSRESGQLHKALQDLGFRLWGVYCWRGLE